MPKKTLTIIGSAKLEAEKERIKRLGRKITKTHKVAPDYWAIYHEEKS